MILISSVPKSLPNKDKCVEIIKFNLWLNGEWEHCTSVGKSISSLQCKKQGTRTIHNNDDLNGIAALTQVDGHTLNAY